MAEDVFSKSIDAILKKKDSYISKSEEDFFKGFSKIEEAIFKAVSEKTYELNAKEGRLIFDEFNTDIVNSLNKTIRDAIEGSSYPTKVSSYLRDFDKIKEFNLEATSNVNDLKVKELEKLVNPVQKAVVKQTLEGLAGAGVDTNFSDPLRNGLFKNIVAGSTFSDLENYLRGFILSNESKLGTFRRYVTQVSRDALNQFDGQVNAKIADEYGLNAYRYVGSIIEDSRPQCLRWVGKGVLLLDELTTEIAWATSSGSGMIPGTTPENFAIYRGGYNCRHSAVPFKLTKSQREELGIGDPKTEENLEKELDKKGVAPLTEAEKDLNLTYGKSKLIPPGLENIVADLKIPDQVFELSENGKYRPATSKARRGTKTYEKELNDFYYLPTTKEVTLGVNGTRWAKSEKFQKAVVIHEYAHRTHGERGIFTGYGVNAYSDPKHVRKFNESEDLLRGKLKKEKLGSKDFDMHEIFYKYRGKFEGWTDRDVLEFSCKYTDTIEALTAGNLGGGHGKKYYRENGGYKRYREWFAHASENYWMGNPVFKAEFPELYDQMNDYYREFVVKKFLSSDLKK